MKTSFIKISTTRTLITLFFLFLAINTSAQVPPPPNDGNQNDQLPISSFIAVGLIAGAAYGIKKMK